MSEFCSECSPFDNQFDFDLFKMAVKLKREYSISFFCEGCNNRGIYKDNEGKIFLAKSIKGKIELHNVNIEDL
jgi:hypothetical protein